jgi:hypothetical protein
MKCISWWPSFVFCGYEHGKRRSCTKEIPLRYCFLAAFLRVDTSKLTFDSLQLHLILLCDFLM